MLLGMDDDEPNIPAEVAAEHERQLDAFLDDLIDEDLDETKGELETPEGGAALETSQGSPADQQPAPGTAAVSGSTEGEPATAVTPPAAPHYSQEEHGRAIEAIRRDGTPEGAIAAMSPEEVITFGLKRAKVQEDTDRIYRERSAAPPAPPSPTATSATPVLPAAEAPAEDLQAMARAAAAKYDLDEDAAAALVGVAVEVGLAARKASDDRLTRLEQSFVQTQRAEEDRLWQDTKAQLAGVYPTAVEGDAFRDLQKTVIEMAQTSLHRDAPSALDRVLALARTAAIASGHKQVTAADREHDGEVAQAKEAGSLPSSTRTLPKVGRKLSYDERMDARISALLDGESPESVTARLGRS
jgi:hypothetical protein